MVIKWGGVNTTWWLGVCTGGIGIWLGRVGVSESRSLSLRKNTHIYVEGVRRNLGDNATRQTRIGYELRNIVMM